MDVEFMVRITGVNGSLIDVSSIQSNQVCVNIFIVFHDITAGVAIQKILSKLRKHFVYCKEVVDMLETH